MKKLLFGAFILSFVSACNSDNISSQNEELDSSDNSTISFASRGCASEEIRTETLLKNPELKQRYISLEANTEKFSNDLTVGKVLTDGTVEIPVVINVLYSNATENVSDARIAEQIDVLNKDFTATNTDINKIPTEFQAVSAGDTKVKFRLDRVIRKSVTTGSWSASTDAMKKSSTGGIDATSPSSYLNIWVVGKIVYGSNTTLGYATFPESVGLWNDGVVIATQFFGKTGASSPFNLGRTATHEVGHYLNLRHIWGDARCGNDLVADTPTQTTSNGGSPTYPLYNRCNGVQRSVMFMNYMDYVNDAAMFMFSNGQKTRVQSVVASSGARAGLRVY